MQREQTRRGFSIHQKVVLEVDFSGSLWGYTDITIVPNTKDLKTIHLHSRQCTIHSITVAAHAAEFAQHDPLSNLSFPKVHDSHYHAELKRKIYSALAEEDEGGLSIAVPKEVSLRHSGIDGVAGMVNDYGTPEPQTPGPSFPQSNSTSDFSPIVVHIEYSVKNPVDGCQFVLPTDAYPYRIPHAYTTPSSPDAARCWVPCIDTIWEKSTWEFEFIVPRYLEERAEELDDLDGDAAEQQGAYPTIVVCSGELVERVAHPYNSSKAIFLFSQPIATSVQHVAWAAGPFHVLPIPPELGASDETVGSTQPLMHAFCLPGHESLLSTSVPFLRSAMTFYASEFGSYPFGSHKLVFVDQLPVQRFDSATLSLVSIDLLHGEDAIDQVFECRQVLSHALACQWVGINIQPRAWSDTWLVNGLGLYITGLFIRKLFGNNEYRFRIKKDMQRVLEYDNGTMPPICQPQSLDAPDPASLAFINLKSPLVLHILDRRLCKSGTSLGLSRVLPKIFLAALSGDLPNGTLSTNYFLRMCRKVSGMDPRAFFDQWVYGSGCPAFGFSASFNRKKMAVEITMRQESAAYKRHQHDEVKLALWRPVQFFEGQMTIRIHEADGTPYEHVLDIRDDFRRYEVPFNTKYKRVRRNTKRYLARQAAAQAAAEGDAEAAEAIGMIDMSFGLDIWEKEQERDNWKVADWTEEDEQVMSGATYEWIRMDADFEWIAAIAFEQPDFMWVSQLQRDRDVVAQLEAVYALSRQATPIVSSTLTKTALVSNYFFRIRCEAVGALVQCATRKMDYLGLFHLFKLFLRYCYEPEDPHQDLFTHTYVPRPNDFSDLPEYFVRKSLLTAISRVRFETGKTPAVIRRFLTDQLKYNDNTANPHSDAFYICTIISALASATVSLAAPERGELLPAENKVQHTTEDEELLQGAVAEIERYRRMDRLIPSPHNVVTVASIEFYVLLSMADLVPNDSRIYFPMTREGNYTQVRMAAFDALFLTKWFAPALMRYILAVMAHDSCRTIRRHVARNVSQSLALLAAMGDMKASVKETESLLIEEDGTLQEKAKEKQKTDVDIMIKTLRKHKEVGKNEIVRQFVMPIAASPEVDHEVRWCLLKLLDILVKPEDEHPAKVMIHLPSTPVTEVPPPLPPFKVPLGAHRTLKANGSVTTSPVMPSVPLAESPLATPAAPKLKLLPGAAPGAKKVKIPATPLTAGPSKPSFKVPPPKKFVPAQDAKPVKSAPKPHVVKAQASGMSHNDLKACRNMLKKLQTHKRATLFLQPVDPIRDRAPNYFDIIKSPMDLGTMGAKLEAGKYKDRFEFEGDLRRVVDNCKLYNAANSYPYNEAAGLESFFDKQWERIKKTLEAADRTHAAAAEAEASAPAPAPAAILKRSGTAPVPTPRPAAPPAPTKPSIKLKVGGTRQASSRETSARPSGPKPREVDLPPPPYVDDGSHDILQEVIAMEEMGKAPPKVVAKRKKSSPSDGEEVDDDDLLALATPAKKEKYSPGPSRAPVTEPKALDIPVEKARASAPKLKLKAKDPSSSRPQTPVREPTGRKRTPINIRKCRDILKSLSRLPEAAIFAKPVDPVLDGCPTYYDEIKHPMDLRTMAERLAAGRYATMEEFREDFMLIVKNCRQFNPPGTFPVTCADATQKAFEKDWAITPERKMAHAEKRSLQNLMGKIVADDISWVFREPVDPVALNIPTYYSIIPKRDARDLRTIQKKLDADQYDSVEAFEADIDLMVRNAITFNGADSEIGVVASLLKQKVKDMLSNMKPQAPPEKEREAKISPADKRAVQSALQKLVAEDVSFFFREPVDPVLLGIPTYYQIIPRKDARDLKTIRKKLDADKYNSIEAVEDDIDLMARNAAKFNGAESEVARAAMQVLARAKGLLGGLTSKKRKDPEKGPPQPSKKARLV